MINWVFIIAIAAAFFISSSAGHQETESRPNANSFSNESPKPLNWEMNDPLMMLLLPGVLVGSGDNDFKNQRPRQQ